MLITLGVALGLVVAGLAYGAYRAGVERTTPDETLVIKPPIRKFEKLPPADVEALRARADQRRSIAADRYRRGDRYGA